MHWRVAGSDVYILGSTHLSDRPLPLDSRMVSAIEAAKVLAFESDFRIQSDLSEWQYTHGTRLRTNLPADLYVDVEREWLALGLSPESLELTPPWLVALRMITARLSGAGFIGEHGIDQLVLAMGEGKQLAFLEPVGTSAIGFSSAPRWEQLTALTAAARIADEEIAEMRVTIDAFVANRPHDLIPFAMRFIQRTPKAAAAVLTGRNRAWLPKLLALLKAREPVVVTVGVMHMVGPGSLPELLGRAGFRCEHVQ